MTSNNKLIAPRIRGSIKSVKMILNALIDGKENYTTITLKICLIFLRIN